jgi:predicted ATPase
VLRFALRWEVDVPVAPLPLPADSHGRDVAGPARIGSVVPFVERARTVAPTLVVDAENAAAIAELCA